jgi:hypothetical protein
MKWKEINERVLDEFMNAFESGVEIHDRDLEEMALLAAEELDLPTFAASHHWLLNFKQKNKIVDRKAKIVGRKKDQHVQEAVDRFMGDIRPILENVPADKVHMSLAEGSNATCTSLRFSTRINRALTWR